MNLFTFRLSRDNVGFIAAAFLQGEFPVLLLNDMLSGGQIKCGPLAVGVPFQK